MQQLVVFPLIFSDVENKLTYADQGVPDVLDGVFVVERFARLTVASHRVVLTLVTHPSAHVARGQIHRHVEVTQGGVAVAVTL